MKLKLNKEVEVEVEDGNDGVTMRDSMEEAYL
jgi:hypothetical protein